MCLSIFFILMDYAALAAAAASVAGNMSSGIIGARFGQQIQQENIRYGLREQREHARLLAESLPSYELAGMKNAGLNPLLESGLSEPSQGSLASSPNQVDFGSLGSDAVAAFQSQRMNESSIQLQESETTRNYVESEVGQQNIKYLQAKTDCTKQEATNLAVEIHEIEERTKYYTSLQDKLVSEAALNRQNINLSKAQEELARKNRESIDKFINHTLPLQWKSMQADIDVKKTQQDLNRISYADISQKVTLNEMSIMQASEALADNIKAAGKEAMLRLGVAELGLRDVDVLRQIKNDPNVFCLRLAASLIGQMSTDCKSDILGNITQVFSACTKAAGGVAGAMIGK